MAKKRKDESQAEFLARRGVQGKKSHEYDIAYKKQNRESARNIGAIPPIQDIDRRRGCECNLMQFGLTYFGQNFWELSEDHKRFIKRIELIALKGGRTLFALPRGFGKSVWSRIAILWCVAYGHRTFTPLIASTGTHAENNYEGVKSLIENPEFAADFPEISFPILQLEGIAQRCSSQTYLTKDEESASTNITYNANKIILPSTEGAYDLLGNWHPNKARNSVIISQGLFAAVRGLSVVRWDGVALRPDFALVDDPQDEESAQSPTQIAKRLRVIKNSLIGSGGHDKTLAVAMAATIIADGDLVEQLLGDPSWTGERVAFFANEPEKKDEMWLGDYKRIRQDYDRNDPEDYFAAREKSTEYYRQNKEAMDAGAVVAWDKCFSAEEGEISAVQHGMNALVDHGDEFYSAEYQNKPALQTDEDNLSTGHLRAATDQNTDKKTVPGWANCLTAAIDVHDDVLFYVVTAWEKDTFGGHVLDYGVFPEQLTFFKQGQVKFGLQEQYPGRSKEAAIRAGLDKILERLKETKYPGQDGSHRHVDRVLIDSGYKQEVIFRSVLDSDPRLFFPSKGEYYGAKGKEFNEITRSRKKSAKNDIQDYGDGWRSCQVDKYRELNRVFYDSNSWKTFIRERIKAAKGTEGALRFFQYDKSHELFYDHMLAEKGTVVEAKGRKVTEWENPFKRDNHWFDCLAYCAVGASMEGCTIQGTEVVKTEMRRRTPRRIGYNGPKAS